MKHHNHPDQLSLCFSLPEVIRQGDGSYVVKPGKPQSKLTPAQFAAQFGSSPDSVYRWITEQHIPPHLVEYAGPRKILILAEAVEKFRAHWKKKRAE